MTAQRADLELLLPFHVNGTLDADERAALEAWLAEDDAARAEAEALAAIRRDLQAEDLASPGELGLARLMRDVDQQDRQAGPQPANLNRRPWAWQAVAAVALAALLGQNALNWRGTAPEGGSFQMARAPEVVMAPALSVSFVPTATEADIRALLVELELEIVAGPSALGLYQLAADDPAAALAALRAAPGIVDSAESLTD